MRLRLGRTTHVEKRHRVDVIINMIASCQLKGLQSRDADENLQVSCATAGLRCEPHMIVRDQLCLITY